MSGQYPGARRYEQQVCLDKVLLLHRNMPLMLAGNLLGSLPIGIVMAYGPGDRTALCWIAALHVLTLLRWLHYRRLDIDDAVPEHVFSQNRTYILFSLFSGCIWGSSGVLFFYPEFQGHFIFLFLTLFAMTSGSMTAQSAQPLNYLAYAIPTISPITVNLFLQQEAFYTWMGVSALVYLSLTLMMSRNLYLSVDRALKLKYENQALLEDLKRQTEAAHQANRDKTRFLATASHDLRQPLHAVNLFVESLWSKLNTDAQRNTLERIRLGLDSLGELLNALLNISQMDTGSLPVNPSDFPLDDILRKLSMEFAPLARSKGLELVIARCNRVVHSDAVLLERMIRNLLSNAIRYTEQGEVRVFCQENKEDCLSIHVADTGPGIPKAHLQDVFDEFFQLNNPERDRSKGLGLGLSIVRRLSKQLDHPIELRSVIGQGTEFIVQLPIGDEAAAAYRITETKPADYLHHLRVLVIDNKVEILDAMQGLLEGWQCRFTGAGSAREALRCIDAGLQPDFVISDYRLPGDMNGHALIQTLRAKIGEFPALLISGDTSAEIVQQTKQANIILLTKPIKPAQLRLAMTQLLRNRGS